MDDSALEVNLTDALVQKNKMCKMYAKKRYNMKFKDKRER